MLARNVLSVCSLAISPLTTASAQAPTTTWATPHPVAVAWDGAVNNEVSLSGDGSVLAFTTNATNMAFVAGGFSDGNGVSDVFVFDRTSGQFELVSRAFGSANTGNGLSTAPAISADGLCVAFHSLASDLVSNDSNNYRDVFVWNRSTLTMVRASVGVSGAGNGSSSYPILDQDGSFVVFESLSTNLVTDDDNNVLDIFVRDLVGNTTQRVSIGDGSNGAQGNARSTNPWISGDGQRVAFQSRATNLVSGGFVASIDNIYVRDLTAQTTTLVSRSSPPAVGANADCERPTISRDGVHVAFASRSLSLVAGFGSSTNQQIYVHDLGTGSTTAASLNASAATPDSFADYCHLSSDGRFVGYFSPATDMVGCDANGMGSDVYLFDRDPDQNGSFYDVAGVTRRASVGSDAVSGSGTAQFLSLSDSGRFVAFLTTDNFDPSDDNGLADVYVHDQGVGFMWSYCTAKTNSLGCVPSIGGVGVPSKSLPAPFLVRATNVLGGVSGICFYGYCAKNGPFQDGVLCVNSPLKRAPVTNSGGAVGTCSGVLETDFRPIIQGSNPLLAIGADFFAQWWYRDPPTASTTGLSDGLWCRIQP